MLAKDRELAQAQQQLMERVSSVKYIIISCVVTLEVRPRLQEEQLRSSEALVAEFQKSLQQKEFELESLKTKVTALFTI